MKKRGATVTNFALIIGALAVGVVILFSFQRMNVQQAQFVSQKQANHIANSIADTIEALSNYPSGGDYSTLISSKEPFTATIKNNVLTVNFFRINKKAKEYLNIPNSYIINSEFSNSGEIYIHYNHNDFIISNSKNLTCNTTDNKCDPDCILLGKCDPACYSNVADGVCNPYCVDINGDGKINSEDLDGICDPDCYSNDYKGGVYDPDCIKSGDGICDPDTNMIHDGICDEDCIKANGVCDPDCKSLDPDCPSKGNGICQPDKGENCKNDVIDCGCDYGEKCIAGCPTKLADKSGCIRESKLIKNGEECNYSCECESNNCIYKHCCPQGEYFDISKGKCISFINDGKCENFAPFNELCNFKGDNDCKCSKLNLGECCQNCKGALSQGCCPKGEKECNGECKKMPNPLKKEGKACKCDNECSSGLYCSLDQDNGGKACCPKGTVWDSKLKKCKVNTCSYPCTPGCKLPKKWDWRNVNGINYLTPVKDQGKCGGCWAFSTVGALEGDYKVTNKCPTCNPDLSEENFIACDYGGTCNGGLPWVAFSDAELYGVTTESCFPFSEQNCDNDPTCASVGYSKSCSDKCSDWSNNLYKVKSYDCSVAGNPEALKRKLVCHGPLSIVSYSFEGQPGAGHAIVLVGYDDNTQKWIIRNSWGSGWGDDGYGYFSYSAPWTHDFYNQISCYASSIIKVKP